MTYHEADLGYEDEPSPYDYCRVCGRTRLSDAGTCAECLAETRDHIREIARMCDALPEEVEHRGINGEAMMLLGPAADPEARGHLEASVLAGRVPADYLDRADGELHPLFVLGTWDMCVRDALEHDEPADRLTVSSAAGYLDMQLTYLGAFPHLPFEDIARDVRACRLHLERVLHDGEQVEQGAPCLRCGRRMVKRTDLLGGVAYECQTCHRQVPESQYRYAVGVAYRAHADRLTLTEMAERVDVPASTLRRWASITRTATADGIVESPPRLRSCGTRSDGRKVYRVTVVEALRDELREATA